MFLTPDKEHQSESTLQPIGCPSHTPSFSSAEASWGNGIDRQTHRIEFAVIEFFFSFRSKHRLNNDLCAKIRLFLFTCGALHFFKLSIFVCLFAHYCCCWTPTLLLLFLWAIQGVFSVSCLNNNEIYRLGLREDRVSSQTALLSLWSRYFCWKEGSPLNGHSKRQDFTLLNLNGFKLQASFYQPHQQNSEICVIYLHSMNGSRLESTSTFIQVSSMWKKSLKWA